MKNFFDALQQWRSLLPVIRCRQCLPVIIAGCISLPPCFSQNINGEKVTVGRESITIINFPDKVLNINFSDDAAYDFYIPKRREEKSISLQFNKEHTDGPATSLLVNEGGRSHMFRLVFDPDYDINDDSRPPLWYDHSNIKELKAFVKKQKDLDVEAMAGLDREREQKEAAERMTAMADGRRQQEMLAAKKSVSPPPATVAQNPAVTDRSSTAGAQDGISPATDSSALSLQTNKTDANRDTIPEEMARATTVSRDTTKENITPKPTAADQKAYSEADLWKRYGSKGIDLYNFPREHVATVIADFFIAKDTLRNFTVSQSLIQTDIPDKINIKADQPINKEVTLTLENIAFKDVYTYYKIRVENNSQEDFLMGRTYMYWYDAHQNAKMIIKSSYLTYVGFFPLVRPKTTQYVVFVTRSPNMTDKESLVLFVDERRKEKGSAGIVIDGTIYNKELSKVQASLRKKEEPAVVQQAADPVKEKRRGKNR